MLSHVLHSLQFISCVVLAVAAICRCLTRTPAGSTYRHLLPFLIAAGFLGWALVVSYGNEVFAAWYSGAMYEVGTAYRILGRAVDPWWVLVGFSILALVPACGLFPPLGRRPVVVALLAVTGLLPSGIGLFGH